MYTVSLIVSFHDLKFTITQNKISSSCWSPMQDPYGLTQVAFLSSSSVASYTRGTPKMHGLPQTILLLTSLPVLCCAFFIQSAFRRYQLSGFMNFINISWLELPCIPTITNISRLESLCTPNSQSLQPSHSTLVALICQWLSFVDSVSTESLPAILSPDRYHTWCLSYCHVVWAVTDSQQPEEKN